MAHSTHSTSFQKFKMISNVMALACLPFWGQTCPISGHEESIFEAIVALKVVVRKPTCSNLNLVAWDLDAAKFRDFEGPAICDCYNKHRVTELLKQLFKTCPLGTCPELIWGLEDAWDAPTPPQ